MGNKGKSKKANKGKSKNSKLTKNQQLWKKETKRINEFIKSYLPKKLVCFRSTFSVRFLSSVFPVYS